MRIAVLKLIVSAVSASVLTFCSLSQLAYLRDISNDEKDESYMFWSSALSSRAFGS